MATELFMRRQLSALRPIDAAGEQALGEIASGEVLRVTVRRPRNVLHHRKFFALIKTIFPHQSLYPTEETLLAAMKVALGYGETVKLPDGRAIIIPKSISFSNMDQTAFDQFYARAVHLILSRILPGVSRAELAREVHEILAGYSDTASGGERASEPGDGPLGGAGAGARDLAAQGAMKTDG